MTQSPEQPPIDFFTTFIEQLRDPSVAHEQFALLAKLLERRLSTPEGDEFDLARTGDEAQDRAALAAWLQRAADAAPYCAPPWGRTVSELLAWLVRHRHAISFETMKVASEAIHDQRWADHSRSLGIDAVADKRDK